MTQKLTGQSMKQSRTTDSYLNRFRFLLRSIAYVYKTQGLKKLTKKIAKYLIPTRSQLVRTYSDPIEAGGEVLDSWQGKSECKSFEIYGLMDSYEYKQTYGPIYFCRFKEATVLTGSDLIQFKNTCYWHKQRHPVFESMISMDRNLHEIKEPGLITIQEVTSNRIEIKSAFSLLGVFDSIWAHFLIQYFPKLNYLHKAHETSPEIKVLVPEALDRQAKTMLEEFLVELGLRDRLVYVDKETTILCSELFWVDHTSWAMDHSETMNTLSVVVPKNVVNFLTSRFDKIECLPPDNDRKERVYLRRAGLRTTQNLAEIDAILSSRGFEIFDPAQMSLPEKKRLFSGAKIIAGQLGSAFTNILMCQPGTSVIGMTNSDRLVDHYFPALASASKINLMILTGINCKPLGPQSNYVIDPDQLSALLDEVLPP